MIPKIIHYCWFGRNPKPQEVLDYIETWKKYNPDYEIKEWNEDNFDIHCCKYVWEAYNVKKFAFVSDYARLYALYTEGGIYLDTDVEVRKSFDSLLGNHSFIGWEKGYLGTGCLASISQQQWVKDVMETYEKQEFIKWTGQLNKEPNPYRLCRILSNYGLVLNGKSALLKDDIKLYPIDFLCAHYGHKRYCITVNTICIHHYRGSWDERNLSLYYKLQGRIINIYKKIIFRYVFNR